MSIRSDNMNLLKNATSAEDILSSNTIGFGGYKQRLKEAGEQTANELIEPLKNLKEAQEMVEKQTTAEGRKAAISVVEGISAQIDGIISAGQSELIQIGVERDENHKKAIEGMKIEMGMLSIRENELKEEEDFISSLVSEGYEPDQFIEQRDLFRKKQALELEKANRQVEESFEDMEQAATGVLDPLRGAIKFLRYDLPDSLENLISLGDKDAVRQSTDRQISNAINDAGVTTAVALPAFGEVWQ